MTGTGYIRSFCEIILTVRCCLQSRSIHRLFLVGLRPPDLLDGFQPQRPPKRTVCDRRHILKAPSMIHCLDRARLAMTMDMTSLIALLVLSLEMAIASMLV